MSQAILRWSGPLAVFNRLSRERNWQFESTSLQRGVGYELDFGRDVEGERYLSLAERIRRGSIVPRIEVPLLVSRTDRNSLKGGPLGSFPSMAPKPPPGRLASLLH